MDNSSAVLPVDTDLLRELINASARTALSHRGDQHEQYVLGQLEATANLVYILCAGRGHTDLETLCQTFAFDALHRLDEISPRNPPNTEQQEDSLA